MKTALLLLPLIFVGCTSAPILYEGGGVDEAALTGIESVQVKPIVYDVEIPVDSEVGMGEFRQAQPEFNKEFLDRLAQSEGKPFNADKGETVLDMTVNGVDFGEVGAIKVRPGRILGSLTLTKDGRVIYSANFQGQVSTGFSTWRTRLQAAHREVARALAERIGNSYP